jgi:hypothetical protein
MFYTDGSQPACSSLFPLDHPGPFLPSHWCSRTNQIQGENTLLRCSRINQIQGENTLLWCSRTNQTQGEKSSMMQPSQSDSRFSIFFLKYPRPFLSYDWCSRTNEIKSEKILVQISLFSLGYMGHVFLLMCRQTMQSDTGTEYVKMSLVLEVSRDIS